LSPAQRRQVPLDQGGPHFRIVNENKDPRTVPAKTGVNIKWDHADASGAYSSTASVQAARAMLNGYGLQNLHTPPALNTRHTKRLAVDMSISWTGDLTINKADGTQTTITTTPKTSMNTDLKAVGATYNVIKYVGVNADKPHPASLVLHHTLGQEGSGSISEPKGNLRSLARRNPGSKRS